MKQYKVTAEEMSLIPAKETKSKRLYLLMKPSVHARLERYTKVTGDSVNNLINTIVEEFVEKNKL